MEHKSLKNIIYYEKNGPKCTKNLKTSILDHLIKILLINSFNGLT